MKILRFIPIVCLLWLATSCERKELPEPVIEEPDFQLSGTLDGNAFSMIAGENNMQANAHVFQDAFGVFHYASAFEPFNCDDCNGLLRIHCTSSQTYATGTIPAEDADIYARSIDLLTSESAQNYMAVQLSTPALNPGEFLWLLDNGNTVYTDQNVQHTFSAPGPQEVVLQMLEPTSCAAVISRTINAGSPELCSVPFEAIDLGGGVVNVALTEELPEGLTLIGWTVDGGIFDGTLTSFAAPMNPFPPHIIEAYFINVQGLPGSYTIAWSGDLVPGCWNDFSWNYITPAPELSKVSVTYQSANGTNYTSVTSENDNPSAFFQINEVAGYEMEIDGLPTRRVGLQFSVYLVNVNDPLDVLWMENVEGEMVFVIPD
jgi:hypothetical protein